ncbi:cation diffusion facilitator family transporter [Thermohalobacter berrensis]|uniref:Cation diffusion facilitator family transporter n=1 Tax=Thermohalobacter berrensis TaxID=99594 RepID=A0A419T0E5_9FIRM|nr:cation diffusion facilitator family transporter [Thermohalobacter berrensis]
MSDKERYRIGNRIIIITIVLNVILAIGKIIIGFTSKSTAILADGIHTVSDVASSIGIIVGFFIAKKPEDKEHQYGHEKAESIAGFLLSLLLIGVGLNIGYSALKLIITGNIKIPGVSAIWAAVISILIKEIQFRITLQGGKRINSTALIADAWHHRSDSLSSIAALIGIIGARFGYKILDPLAGLIVSIIVIKVGLELFLHGYNELMDVSIEQEKIDEISNKLLHETDITRLDELRARKHGSKVYVDIRVSVDPNITVHKGHDIAEDVEKVVYQNIANVKDVLVHVNPCFEEEK